MGVDAGTQDGDDVALRIEMDLGDAWYVQRETGHYMYPPMLQLSSETESDE